MPSSNAVEHASPTTFKSLNKPEDMVTHGLEITAAVKGSAEANGVQDIQTTADAWKKELDNLDKDNGEVADLEAQLKAATKKRARTFRRCFTRRDALFAAIDAHCDGSADKVHACNVDVAVREPLPVAVVPEGLRRRKGLKIGEANIVWDRQPGAQGFMVQWATDPATPASYSPPILTSKASFDLEGQAPGTVIHFRVLALDARLPAKQTAYTVWLPVMIAP